MDDIFDSKISEVADALSLTEQMYGDDEERLYTDEMTIRIAGWVHRWITDNVSPIPSPREVDSFVWHRDGLGHLLERHDVIMDGRLIPSVDLILISAYTMAMFGYTGNEAIELYDDDDEFWDDEDQDEADLWDVSLG